MRILMGGFIALDLALLSPKASLFNCAYSLAAHKKRREA
jgi:hypothetical protein